MTVIRQRLIVLIAIVIAGMIYLWGLPGWRSAEGIAGASLLYAASPVAAIGWAIVLTAAAGVIAAFTAAQGRILHAAIVLSIGLLFPAIKGGTIDERLRSFEDSSGYWVFALESVVWLLVLGVALWVVAAIAQRLRRQFRPPEQEDGSEPPAAGAASAARGAVKSTDTLAAAALTLIVGSVLTMLLLQTAERGQAIAGLILAFGLAAGAAHQSFRSAHPLPMLLSPLILSIFAYAYAAMTGGTSEAMLTRYFEGDFIHPALALPIYYASAGVAGVTLGLLWSHSLAAEPEDPSLAGVASR